MEEWETTDQHHILNVEFTLFPFRFDMECDRRRGNKEDVENSAGMRKASKGVFGER